MALQERFHLEGVGAQEGSGAVGAEEVGGGGLVARGVGMEVAEG